MEFKVHALIRYEELEKMQANIAKEVKARKLEIDKEMKGRKAQIKAELSSLYKHLVVIGAKKKKAAAKK